MQRLVVMLQKSIKTIINKNFLIFCSVVKEHNLFYNKHIFLIIKPLKYTSPELTCIKKERELK